MTICENLIVEETLFDRFPLESAFDNRRWWIREKLPGSNWGGARTPSWGGNSRGI